ncbi:MAG TPA: biliverdin-producing heme oxygenase [Kofleriaceae bacterium]|nr:biliverdin-producing heme oxygenase [Kofleriaceae bacterium]
MTPGRLVLRALKEGTRALHHDAERYVRILDADATLADYARYLAAMRGFHAPLEDIFAHDPALAAAGFAASERRKTAFLTADLKTIASLLANPAHLPCASATLCCPDLPASTSFARRLGIAYVIEGSTLGGKFILAHLPPAIAAVRGRATRFLEGYGAATAARWRSFCALVEHAVRDPVCEAEVIAAACDTFARLIAWLARFEAPLDLRVQGRMRDAS